MRLPPPPLLLATVLPCVLWVGCATAARADAAGRPDCSTPRRAVATWLDHLQDETWRPEVAVACFDWASVQVAADERAGLAIRLKRVLDARGHYVQLDELPDAADAEGQTRVTPLPDELPSLQLVRRGQRWLVSASAIEAIPELYSQTFAVDVEGYLQQLPDWVRDEALWGVRWWQLLGLLALTFLGLAVRTLLAWLVTSQGGRLLRRHGSSADTAVLGKAGRPIGTLAMGAVIWQLLPILELGPRVTAVGFVALRVMIAAAAVMLLYRLVDVLSDVFARRAERTETKLDDQLVPLVRRTLKVFVVVLGGIFVLQNMDVDVGSLLAGASLGGLAFTLAARDTVANFFGSVSIFAERPFQIGDWVVIHGFEGIVEEVGMRSTRIRTFYNSLVTMPNSLIATSTVDNFGAREYRRCFATLGVTYDTTPEQMQAFCEGIRAILAANPHVRQDFYEVHFAGFGAHALDVMVYFFFDVTTWSDELEQRHNVFLEIVRLADELGVAFAFPTQTLHVASMAQPSPPPDRRVPGERDLVTAIEAFGPGGPRARPRGAKLTHGFFPGGPRRAGSEQDGG